MPFYEYYCEDCESKFDVFHSMSDEWEDGCKFCKSNNIVKVVSDIGKKIDEKKFKKRVGDVVKSHIEDSKKSIKQEKKKMKREMYND